MQPFVTHHQEGRTIVYKLIYEKETGSSSVEPVLFRKQSERKRQNHVLKSIIHNAEFNLLDVIGND
jgi:hypothetical protein